jgi:hypothetical protein
MQAVVLLVFASLLPVHASAQDKGPCSKATLKGEYAAYISGVRSFGGITENFVGISLRKYDGNGNFTEEFASFHAISGFISIPATYKQHNHFTFSNHCG